MRDFSQPCRAAVLRAMKGDAGIIALVPPASIFPPLVAGLPTFPFIRYGLPTEVPFGASGMNGQTLTPTLHAFAKGGDENVGAIKAAILHLFGGTVGEDVGYELDLQLPGASATLYVTGGTTLQDADEVTAFHAVLNLRIDVVA
jgi:hypothetical protein